MNSPSFTQPPFSTQYSPTGLILGIDATNLRAGGGRTHLLELLGHAASQTHGVDKVVVWGARSTLALLEERTWLVKRNPPAQEGRLLRRSLWQRFELARQARAEGCHLLFVPGGSYGGDFHPTVTMSQNMLPFEWQELRRYGFSITTLKLLALRWTQSNSFKTADGVIFLTGYAAREVQRVSGLLHGQTQIIPHGLNRRFYQPPKPQRAIRDHTTAEPYRLLYVSIVNQYKHQWHVVEAVGALRRKTGWPLTLDLVGPAYPAALSRLQKAMAKWDSHGEWVKYHGAVQYVELHKLYGRANLGVFASSCENMPNILLETMAAGLPVASSNRGPMPEILGDAGVYFDPENPDDIAATLERLIGNPELRATLAEKSHAAAQQYSWEACADQTFTFIADVYRQWAEKQ
jgi:glycosyltransferase involved in cell wall biosynthesis